MSAVTRQTRANLRGGRVQAAIVVLVVVAATALLTVAASTMGATGGAYERLFERTAGAHLWLQLDPEIVDPETVRGTLSAVPGVAEVAAGRLTVRGADLRLGEGRATVHLREWVPDGEPVGRLAVLDGTAPTAPDEVALDVNVVRTHELALGDDVEVLTPTGWRPATLTTVTASPEMCPYPTCQPSVAHLGVGGLDAFDLLPAPGLEGLLFPVRVTPDASVASVREAIDRALPPGAITMAHDHEVIAETTSYLLQVQSVFLLAFGLVAALAAGALIANAIGESVRSQTRRIGLLKAVGFTRAQVARTYLAEQLGLTALGAAVGVAVGVVVARASLRSVAAQFGEPRLHVPVWVLLAVPITVLAVAAVFTVLPVRRAARIDTITAIRTGSAARPRRPARLRAHLPTAIALGLADLRARPTRTLVTTVTVTAAVVTLVFASGTSATLRWFVEDPAAGFRPAAELTVLRPPLLSDAEIRATFAEHAEVAAVTSDAWVPFRFPGGDEQLQVRFLDGTDAFEVVLLEGRSFERPGEVVTGYALARDHDLGIGDRRTLVIDGASVEVEVVGVYREASNLGQLLLGDVATLDGVVDEVAPFQYHLALAPGSDPAAVAAALREATDEALHPVVTAEAGLGILDSMPAIMTGLSVVLATIAMLGVAATVWMGVQERRRDTGLLKAIGTTPEQVLGSVLAGVSAVAVVAFLIGLPLGLLGTSGVLDLLARQLGFGPLAPRFAAGQLASILPATAAIAVLAAVLPGRRSARVPVAEALRYE
jgi:putative ABC transport system permease protein